MDLKTNLVEKWQPILEHDDLPEIGDSHKRAVTAQLLENTEIALRELCVFCSDFFICESVCLSFVK